MQTITVLCPAKINLFFNIIGLDERKYHLIHGLNQTVSIYDEITINKTTTNNIVLHCNDQNIPLDEKNSVHKATTVFFEYTKISSGVDITITKNIPTMAGLGGESTDVAGTLSALNKLFNTNLSQEELLKLNYKISCDAPFCYLGGSKDVKGCGEIIEEWQNPYDNYLIVTPNIASNTKEMFSLYDSKIDKYHTVEPTIGHNDFHLVTHPQILALKSKMDETNPTTSFLTGSGSSIVAIYQTKTKLNKALKTLKNELPQEYKINVAYNCDGISFKN